MTDWTIVLNAATSTIGSASSRIALLVSEFCTKSAIVVVAPGSFVNHKQYFQRNFLTVAKNGVKMRLNYIMQQKQQSI